MDPIMGNQEAAAEPKKSFGPLIGIVVIVILLVVGAFYLWGEKLSNRDAESAAVTASDDIESIEADLETAPATDVDFSDLE